MRNIGGFNIFKRIRVTLIQLLLLIFPLTAVYGAEPDGLSSSTELQSSSLKEEAYASTIDRAKELRASLKQKEEPDNESLIVRPGGWLSTSYRQYHNIYHRKSIEDFLKWSWTQEAYFWLYMNYQATHSVYAQVSDSYIDRSVGSTYTGIGADNAGPALSMAWTQMNLQPKYEVPLKLTFGRQYLFLGRGVTYSAIHDGLMAEYSDPKFYAKSFISKTKPHEDDIDYSLPGFDKGGARIFGGLEAAYLGFKNATLYGYGLVQKDRSSANPTTPSQNFHYDSYYLGTGATYEPWEPLEIWSEAISEFGHGFTDASRTDLNRTTIRAWAALAGAKVRWEQPTHPVVEVSAAYGSGDKDRTSVTNTVGGDLDKHDHNFLYFGNYQAGYSFQPRLSNITILSLGGSFKPFEEDHYLNKLALGSKYYFYWKARREGGTSDIVSVENDATLGQEMDFFLHWKIQKNTTFSTRYGIFFPGEAFPEQFRDHTEYFFSSLTLDF